MSIFLYPAKFRDDGHGRVLVEFADFPRLATDGKDKGEAMTEAMDALGSELSIRLARKEGIPAASNLKRGQVGVPVPFWLAPKLALFMAMRDERISNLDLAERIGVDEKVIRRMLDPKHATKAERIQNALSALGRQLTVDVLRNRASA